MSETIIGIDLGTTNSAVAVFRGGAPLILENALGEKLTPSVVALDERSGALVVGRTAKDIYALHPSSGAAAFKRGMGTDLTYPVAGTRYGAPDLSALVLKSLRRDAETALGEEIRRAVITVPAYFNDAQRYATMKAGELAGLDVERVLNEPTAAAIAHGAHRRTDGTLLVFDLGGGTFDVCVMDRFEGALEVRSVAGESQLGGEDFTRRLAALALTKAGCSFERAEFLDPEALVLLTKRSELLKRRLSDEPGGAIAVPAVKELLAAPVEVEITAEEADEVFAPLVDRLVGPCRRALKGAGLNRTDLDEIILVGGATRMPRVRRFVNELFQADPQGGVDPDLAVVHGAALQAALQADDAAVRDMVVTDVASHSLGIKIMKDIGTKEVDGFFAPVIHRNTVIPTSRSDVFYTRVANQTQLRLEVFEGESRYVKENRHIGQLLVTRIPKGPRGRPVEVRFTYDLNGILEVEATVVETGATHSAIFTRDSKNLSEEELRAAASRLERLKEDPRDQPKVRDLIARAEALLRELDPLARRELERALDSLEAALVERDPEAVELWSRHLRELCEDHDSGERW